MLYVSLVEIYQKSVNGYVQAGFDDQTSSRYATLSYFGGCCLMMVLDKFVDWLLNYEDDEDDDEDEGKSSINDDNNDGSGVGGGGNSSGNVAPTEVNNRNNQTDITAAGAGRRHQQQYEHEHEQLPAVAGVIDGLAKHPGDELDEMRHKFVDKVKRQQERQEKLKRKEEESGGETWSVGTTDTNTNTNLDSKNADVDVDVDDVDVDKEEEDVEAGSVAVAAGHAVVVDSSTDPAGSSEAVTTATGDNTSTVAGGTTMPNNTNKTTTPDSQPKKLRSMGFAMALAIGIHNFPEGMASYLAYQADPAVGIALAVGIAFHNIPEGLCVSMPLYYATSRRWYSFWWGALSGLTEPLGALFAWLVLKNGLDGTTNGVLFGTVAGMMTVISIQELLPNAHKYARNGSTVTYSFLSGAFVIALSIMLFQAE